jgi:hypothetical protein
VTPSPAYVVVCYLALIVAVGLLEPPDPFASILLVGSTVLVGAVIGRWWIVPLLTIAMGIVSAAIDHATGCTGSDGCETALLVFVLMPMYAAILTAGVLAGVAARRRWPAPERETRRGRSA